MRIERISLQLGDGEVRTFQLHRGFTVVEASPGEETQLTRALLGTLQAAMDGVHVELSLDDGSALVAFRPVGAPHRVIDVETTADRTEAFRRPDGGIDVLHPWRGERPGLGRDLMITVDDLREADPTEHWLAQLAPLEPAVVLTAAAEEVAAEHELRRATVAARNLEQPAAAPDQVARARARRQALERRYRVLLPVTLVAGSAMATSAAVWVDDLGSAGAGALVAGCVALVAGTLLYGRRVGRAGSAERRIQDSAVHDRTGLAAAALRYRSAASAWQDLAGTIPAPWVLAERDRLDRAARQHSSLAAAPGDVPPIAPAPAAANLMAGLTVRASAARATGPSAEALPIFLADPLVGLRREEKASVLEFLGRLAAENQIVLVTADPEVLSWARLEAMTGAVGAITASAEGALPQGGVSGPTPHRH